MICLLGLAFFTPSFAALAADTRTPIMVSKFENRSNWRGSWDLGNAWGALLTDALNDTGKFIVLGEKDMRREALEEQAFSASGAAAGGGKSVQFGNMTSAQLLIKGSITHFENSQGGADTGLSYGGFSLKTDTAKATIDVVIYVIDSTTGQVVASETCRGKVKKSGLKVGVDKDGFVGDLGGFKKTTAGEAMEKAVIQGVAFIVANLPETAWTGKVIKVKGNKVYINRGSREGVKKGDVFIVGISEILRDPDTGEILDEDMETKGKIKAHKVKKKVSICKIIDGGGIARDMTVMEPE